ncbi:MAG: Maf family protein [Alphaproteobacteria bacterium]|nr:Maf family protein [Alphaproteobacteria bacterium]
MSIILASASYIRATLLRNAGLNIKSHPASIDEEAIAHERKKMGTPPEEIALWLARAKAEKVSRLFKNQHVIGVDQVLVQGKEFLEKPKNHAEALIQLGKLSAKQHTLFTSAVIFKDGNELWSVTTTAMMSMHELQQEEIVEYLKRNPTVIHNLGSYNFEGEGIRLFKKVVGDYFSILGIPVLEIINFFRREGQLFI